MLQLALLEGFEALQSPGSFDMSLRYFKQPNNEGWHIHQIYMMPTAVYRAPRNFRY